MIVKATFKGKEIELNIQESQYWINRKEQSVLPYWKDTDALENRMTKEFKSAYNELEKELYTFAGKFGTEGKLKYSQARVIALMKEIKPHVDGLYDVHQTNLTEHLMSVYEGNFLRGSYDLATGTNVAYSFSGINETAVKTAISFPFQGVNFSDQIWQDKNYLLYKLKKHITDGIIRGDSIESMAKMLMYQVKNREGNLVDRGPLGKSKFDAMRLIQTETANVMSASDEKAYNNYGLEEYEYVATLDDKTSSICRALDGKVFDVKNYTPGVNAPVMHVFERSTTAPYFSDNFGERIARDIKTGKAEYIPSHTSYEEWFSKYIK